MEMCVRVSVSCSYTHTHTHIDNHFSPLLSPLSEEQTLFTVGFSRTTCDCERTVARIKKPITLSEADKSGPDVRVFGVQIFFRKMTKRSI